MGYPQSAQTRATTGSSASERPIAHSHNLISRAAHVIERVRDELKAEGFGILSEIDVQATLREKLGVDEEPYLILGACNPPLAHQALSAEPELGTLLPCNVVVYQRNGQTRISAIDAERMLSIVGNDSLASVAAEVRSKLAAVVERASNPI